jgi:cellobiose-specific phosphotransferase system component IIA
MVQNNITCVNSVVKKTPDVAQAESALREAALHYTGGHSITATIFRGKAEEESAFEFMEIAFAHYREALETAELSEKTRIREALETAELSEMAKILRSSP